LKENKRESIEKNIKEAISSLNDANLKSNGANLTKDDCPFSLRDPNPRFPPLSSSLDVVFEENRGRFVTANMDIEAGQVIVIEDPIVAGLSPSASNTSCHHCFR